MKLLIASDSHGLTEELIELKRRYGGEMDAMIHCGDSELRADEEAIRDFLTVRGNCDYERKFPLDITKEIGDSKIFVTHGHHYNVKMTLLNLSYKAKEVGADFVFFGHSHILGAELIENTLFLNPGSLLMPRGRTERTYAVVEKNGNTIRVSFYTDKHRELEDLRQEFSL
ncbi:metallophosphoesterase [Weizmannia coagulans]|jgi:putative phosphoesterase|uniref:Phosphoesterase n=3 Tax=Heyndrickxia TaxID=2837504 RepID=A0A0C5CLW4_HEYCO|nr:MULTISPECIES: metallophosphoesterase [Heyndrickxia]NWN95097.1 metallophosphoesterase [Bacillus sp. (in: firmicutes)]AEP01780.1 phosphodiesterase, MJ0936 family [Heyndrickxia coagulans 36D1]AJO22367.1 phosphodiesterase [Heyndrickxia coagulans]AKN56100.1 phosphoesterase [Heyndrickxia coagulans]APB36629.1 YfcE family phosphodiesterase [Heyndrickxia coagulans]